MTASPGALKGESEERMDTVSAATDEFADFVRSAEPRLRLALGSAFGFHLGEDATAEALAFAWENWERVMASSNPIGYLFGVGRKTVRRGLRRQPPRLPAVRAAGRAGPAVRTTTGSGDAAALFRVDAGRSR